MQRVSRPLYLHVATPASSLQTAILQRLRTYRSPPNLQTTRALELHAPPSTGQQRASDTPTLYTSECLHACSAPLELHTLHTLHISTFARLQPTFSAPGLYTSTSTQRTADSRPPCLHVCTPAARFQHSIPPRLDACSAPSKLPSSIPPHLHGRSTPPELPSSIHACTSTRLQRASRAPFHHLHSRSAPKREFLNASTCFTNTLIQCSRAIVLRACRPEK